MKFNEIISSLINIIVILRTIAFVIVRGHSTFFTGLRSHDLVDYVAKFRGVCRFLTPPFLFDLGKSGRDLFSNLVLGFETPLTESVDSAGDFASNLSQKF